MYIHSDSHAHLPQSGLSPARGPAARGPTARGPATRGFALLVVLVATLVLSGIGISLLATANRDQAEARLQMNNVKALYAAEGSVTYGIDQLRPLLRRNTAPSPSELHALNPPDMPGVEFLTDEYRIDYVDPANNYSIIDTPSTLIKPLDSGLFSGLNAQQIPIQVMSTARYNGAYASIADVVRLELIPVFQFAIFFDQPIEYYFPEPSTITGRVHSNDGFFFGDGANAITVTGAVTTAGRINLRSLADTTSKEAGRNPNLNGKSLPCDNPATGTADACPGSAPWLTYTQTNMPLVRDAAHGVPALHLPTGSDDSTFNKRVMGVPDMCGENSSGKVVAGAGQGMPLSADWQLIDLPRSSDSSALKEVKYAYRADIRAIDGVWEKKDASGTFVPWFRQSDPSSAETQCVYYGYNPNGGDAGTALGNSDGVPAIRDIRFWDYQDRRMRRALAVDLHRLRRCLPDLDTASFGGTVYIGETPDATVDNWGLNPDAQFYRTTATTCDTNFLKLPHHLRGQFSSVAGIGATSASMPSYLANDDTNGVLPLLDNPYYPATGFCTPTALRKRGLGDGPYRLPQGNGNGTIEPGRNELVESAVLLRNGARVPNASVASGTGGVRDRGFSFATNTGLYLQGDFNIKKGTFSATASGYTNGKVPFSVAGDAVTFLSEKYNDLQENPFAPVGPMAVWDTIHVSASKITDHQRTTSSIKRYWTPLNLAETAATASLDRLSTDLVDATTSTKPNSPAPCVNLLRELSLRPFLANSGASIGGILYNTLTGIGGLCSNSDNCGLNGLTRLGSAAPALSFGRDWFTDLSATPLPLRQDSNSLVPLFSTGTIDQYMRLSNAFVAFAPLESFLDTSMYQEVNTSSTKYSSRAGLPTRRTDREVLRDWMRCTLNSQHHLAVNETLASIQYSAAPTTAPTVIVGTQPQIFASSDPENGMKALGGASIDVTYKNILGNDGFAPMSTDAVFRTATGDALFTRDRSSLTDSNGESSPSVMTVTAASNNITAAAVGDQLALNVSILAGSTWNCPNPLPFPTASANYPLNNSMTGLGSQGAYWAFTGGDEGTYGMFRYQESWAQISRSGASRYIDFFVNGSVVAMFHSPLSNGRHLVNQGFVPNMISGGSCGGQDNNQTKARSCRIHPGFEYAWESSRRSVSYDPDNDKPDFLPPATPMVINTTRLRWVRR